MNILRIFITPLPLQKAYAHCDVPCGIYDPKPAQIAAQTVLTMVKKLLDIAKETGCVCEDPEKKLQYENLVTRMIWTKEEHARKCKEELLILWTDYFKPEHLEKFPNLHETFWQAAKLCSKNKQEVNLQVAQNLVKTVDTIADLFTQAKAH